jgi:hypothetical protein
MKKTISLLHTADVHVSTFEALLAESDVALIHTVREDWLEDARRDGLTDDLTSMISEHLRTSAADADVVICTCSTLGPIAEQLNLPEVFRIDQPMMDLAAQNSPVLLAMCLQSTVLPSTQLLESAFARAGKAADYRTMLCGEAWPHFESGSLEKFGHTIGAAVRSNMELHPQTGCVVLAQASMTAAEPYLADIGVPVHSSPPLAAAKALQMCNS